MFQTRTSDDEAPGPSTGNMTRETKRKCGKGTAGEKLEGFMSQMLLMQEESEKRFYEAERRWEEHEAKQEEKRQKLSGSRRKTGRFSSKSFADSQNQMQTEA